MAKTYDEVLPTIEKLHKNDYQVKDIAIRAGKAMETPYETIKGWFVEARGDFDKLKEKASGGSAGPKPPVEKEKPVIAWSSLEFEGSAEDGSVTGTAIGTPDWKNSEVTFAVDGELTADTHFTAANVPAGLTMKATITGGNVNVTFTGNATAKEDVENVTITLKDTVFSEAIVASVPSVTSGNMSIIFV